VTCSDCSSASIVSSLDPVRLELCSTAKPSALTGGSADRNAELVNAASCRSAAQHTMLYGALSCVGGTVATIISYSAAAPGGTYVVAWGAIIFGAVRFWKGLEQVLSLRSAESKPDSCWPGST